MNAHIGQGGLFLYMAGTATACTAAVLFLCSKLLQPGLLQYIPIAAPLAAVFFYAAILGLCCLYGLLLLCTCTDWFHGNTVQAVLRVYLHGLFPLVKIQGRFMGNTQDLCHDYIHFMNHLVLRQRLHFPANRVLLLAPHCLQWDKCPHKITRNISNCHQCGQCPVGAIVKLAEEMGITFAVATGGTLARQIVKESRPQAVVAIACERDLISGMEDIAPMPVLGLLNKRPNGPCFNTDVDLQELQHMLKLIIGD